MKHTTLNPDIKQDNPKNKNPANPNAMEMFDCMQNALLALHVSIPLSALANAVPAEFADTNRYANT